MSRTARAIALAMAFTSSAWGASAGENACEREMARAALKHGVPLGMLYAVGLTETGRGELATSVRAEHRGPARL